MHFFPDQKFALVRMKLIFVKAGDNNKKVSQILVEFISTYYSNFQKNAFSGKYSGNFLV
jgi:hypothetical protein